MTDLLQLDPDRDLVLERVVPAPPARVWRAWTEPAQLRQWWCPRPWTTPECDIDLRPGGQFRFVLAGPGGERFEHRACYLEVVPERRLIYTEALAAGFRPQRPSHAVPVYTAIIALAPDGTGTRYTATVRHVDADGARRHADMGFHAGWGAALDQLIELVG